MENCYGIFQISVNLILSDRATFFQQIITKVTIFPLLTSKVVLIRSKLNLPGNTLLFLGVFINIKANDAFGLQDHILSCFLLLQLLLRISHANMVLSFKKSIP